MAFRLSKTELIERALRLCRAFSINDVAPDPAYTEEAEFWLTMFLAELSEGARLIQKTRTDGRTITLTTAVQEVDLTAGTPDTDEEDPSLTQVPPNGIVDLRSVRLIIDGDDQGELRLLRSFEWEQIDDKAETGKPRRALFVMRGNEQPSLLLHPIPSFSSGTWQLRCVFQEHFAKQVDDTDDEVNIRAGWQRMLVYRLAADIGGGAVVSRPLNEVNNWRNEYVAARKQLEAYSNRERVSKPRVVGGNPYGYGGVPCEPRTDYRRTDD